MDVCYELNVPKSLQTQGIQSIEVTRSFDYFGGDQETEYIKVRPPRYLHQNIDVRSKPVKLNRREMPRRPSCITESYILTKSDLVLNFPRLFF